MQFTVLVHEDVDGGYWGECLELPGCISQGDTLDEMDYNIREAIEVVLEVKMESGENLSNLQAQESVADPETNPRKWIIEVSVPDLASVNHASA